MHPGETMDWIELTDCKIDAIVGILPSERVTEQPMQLRLRMAMDLGPIGESGDLGLGIDYAAVEAQVRFLAVEGRFWLIETLGLAVARWLLLAPTADETRGVIDRVEVSIRKPTILAGRAVPGVRIARDGPWEAEELVHTDRDYAARVRVDGSWVLGPGRAAMVIAGELEQHSRAVTLGERLREGAEVTGKGTLLVTGAAAKHRSGESGK